MKNFIITAFYIVFVGLLATHNAWGEDLPAKKQTKAGLYLTAAEAGDLLQDGTVLFLDVRTHAEIAYVGIADRVDLNIPLYVFSDKAAFDPAKGTFTTEANPLFLSEFSEFMLENGLPYDTRIVIICRSGARSATAANLLFDFGFPNVYSVTDGFEGDKMAEGPSKGQRVVNGWKNAGLSWSYSIAEYQVAPMW